VERRLARGRCATRDSITAVVVTHEHGDHIAGVARLAASLRHRGLVLPRHLEGGPRCPEVVGCGCSRPWPRVSHRRLALRPIPVPHDAREPCQWVIEADAGRLGVLTDAGTVTPKMCDALRDCDALVLEANHDPQCCAPDPIRQSAAAYRRPFGHLSNAQAAHLFDRVRHGGLHRLLLSHLSQQNNRPEHAVAALRSCRATSSRWWRSRTAVPAVEV
jgi:phosphoribosyl 1,2-cyclic phosphodiesterase